MFVTQTADAAASPVEVAQSDYSQFFDITNQLHSSCGFADIAIFDEAGTTALSDARFSVAGGGSDPQTQSLYVAKQTAHG